MFQENIEYQIIDEVESVPRLYSKKCRIIALILRLFLQYATVIISLAVWFLYDFFIAILTLVLTFIVMGIVRSKLRNSVIPFKQREHHYDDGAIAAWYTAKALCYSEV